MCAICGALRLEGEAPVPEERIVRMRDSMTHRGPDDAGAWGEGPIGLGHRRLSIIDLAGGHQPMIDASGRYVIVFNGEIYNFPEIRERLTARGHVFRTRSDTEVILEAWAGLGEDECLRTLRGIFAFAVWDRERRRLALVRDHVGVKPLYWTVADGTLLFASEIKALLQWPDVPRAVDEIALRDFLRLRYVPGPRTMFRGISKLLPGHVLIAEKGRTSDRCWWDLEEPGAWNGDDPPRELLRRIDDAVRLQLVSDVPLGAFLSGGIDSSTVVALMAGRMAHPVRTFSIGYPEAGEGGAITEFAFARMTADRYRTDHHERTLDSSQFWGLLERLIWHFDEPVADPASVPLYLLARFARESVTVALSGEGADEILGGYSTYQRTLAIDRVSRFPGVGLAARAVRPFASRKLRRRLDSIAQPMDVRYRGVSALFSSAEADVLLGPDATASHAEDSTHSYFTRWTTLDPLRQMLYFDLKVWLPDDLLVKADKMTMASSLELRVPFLDHELVEWAWRLPGEWKLRNGYGKWALREAVREIVPEASVTRPKLGFPVPIRSWFERHLGDAARRLLRDSPGLCPGLLEPEAVEALISRHERGGIDLSGEIFALVTLAVWYRVFIASGSVPANPPAGSFPV